MEQYDLEVGELGRLEALVLGARRARLERLGLRDERADDVRLAPGAQLLADALVRAVALALARGDVGGDRAPALRQLAQRRDVERAERRQPQRARDRRRGHMQHVRREAVRRLGVERRALADA